MAKSSKKPRRQEPPAPLAAHVPRNAARNGGRSCGSSASGTFLVLEKREADPSDQLI